MLKKYAIAICDLFENQNEIKIIEAESEIDALVSVLDIDDIVETNNMNVEEILQYAFDGDLVVSKPVVI